MLAKVLDKFPIFDKIKTFLTQNPEYHAYVVGGFVRDMLLQESNKDIDIVVVSDKKTTDKIGVEFAKKLATFLNVENVNYFENFGTANFIHNEIEIEIVGARKESYDRGSRKPIVEDGTLDDDLMRRDFTFNAMAVSLNPADFGDLIDKFNGIRDLNDGVIKTPLDPNITFSDDPLRMLRAIRFSSRLQYEIDSLTYKAIKDNVYRLEIISMERIVQELNKILLSKKPSHGLKLLQDSGLLKKFLPELSALDAVEVIDGKGHKNNFYHTIQVVDQTRELTSDIVVLWAAMLHDIGKAKTKRFGEFGWTFHDHENVGAKMVMSIFHRMKLPINKWAPKVVAITKLHGRLKILTDESIQVSDAACRRIAFEAGEFLDDLLLFVKCDITTRNEEKKLKYQKNYDLLQTRILDIAAKDDLRNFKVPISGDEIMTTFNLKPCKTIALIKDDIKNAILDGKIANDEAVARDYMMQIAKQYL